MESGSEWKLHRSWFDRSAMADLLGDDFRLAAKDTLCHHHKRLLDHRDAHFNHLQGPLPLTLSQHLQRIRLARAKTRVVHFNTS